MDPARKLREKMLILLIIAALFIMGYYGPSVEAMFGETGTKVFIWALGIVILAFVIIKDLAKMHGNLGSDSHHSSGGGYSVDELEEMDIMDEDE